MSSETLSAAPGKPAMSVFERYLTLWVALCIVAGIVLGHLLPGLFQLIGTMEIAKVNLPVAVLIWLMIIPMLIKIDFSALHEVRRHWRGIGVTLFVNWAVKPFSMALLGWLFIGYLFRPWLPADQISSYIAGLIILAAAPCTAMVFVWSLLVRGDPAYTLVQVALNDLIMLVAFAPIVIVLLDVSDIAVPWDTVAASVVLYIVIPLAVGWAIRTRLIARRGGEWFTEVFLRRLSIVTPTGLIATLVVLFSFQGDVILDNPLHIALIAVPLIVQTVLIYSVGYSLMRWRRVRHAVAAPGALVGASNFFELAVAAAIALFGLGSGAALATVVGVLVEVPLMLALVRHADRTRDRFPMPPVGAPA